MCLHDQINSWKDRLDYRGTKQLANSDISQFGRSQQRCNDLQGDKCADRDKKLAVVGAAHRGKVETKSHKSVEIPGLDKGIM